jgi:hypothetical protein
LTPSARSANLIAGDGTKNGFPAPNKEPATNQKYGLTGKAPYKVEPPLGKQILHVAVAQGEAEVEPNRVLDNRRRKAVAAIREQGHGERLSDPPLALTPFP